MKSTYLVFASAFCALLFSFDAAAELYRVSVTRISDNIYRTSGGTFIQTEFCFEYATSEEAILKYDQYSYDNQLIFVSSKTQCNVKKVFK